MKLDFSRQLATEGRASSDFSLARERNDWRKRQTARARSVRTLAGGGRRGLGWSLICTGTLWLLLFLALGLAFKT